MWSPPGAHNDPSRWRLDIAAPKRGQGGTTWRPPGSVADRGGLQYHLPEGASPDTTQQSHLLVSPPGTPAPSHLPNWTPSAKRMSLPGEQAPVDQLNLTPLSLPGAASPTTAARSPLGSPPTGGGVGAGQSSPDPAWWDSPSVDLPPSGDSATYSPGTTPSSGTAPSSAPDGPSTQGQPITDSQTGQVIGYVIGEPDPANPGQPKYTVHWTSSSAPKNTKATIKMDDGIHVVTTDADGKIVNNEIVGQAPAGSKKGTGISRNDPYIQNSDGSLTRNPGYTPPNAPRGSGHSIVRQEDDGPHNVWISVDDQGRPTGETDLGPARQSTSGVKGISRNDPAYVDANGNVVQNPYYDPTASRPTGIPGNDPYIWDPNANDGKGAMVKNPGYQTPQTFETVGNTGYAFDPVTGSLKPLATAPTQLSTTTLRDPYGAQDVLEMDPYTGQVSDAMHTPGAPIEVGHQIFYPSDYSGPQTSYDMGSHKLSTTQRQGTPWKPPAGVQSGSLRPQAPSPSSTPSTAVAPPPTAALPPAAPAQKGVLAPGLAGTADDPTLGQTPPGAFTNPLPTPAPTDSQPGEMQWHPPGAGPQDGSDDPGSGQDEPQQPQGQGGVWRPPIDPKHVVGTGHKFGEQVSIEGTHKGVDLQAYRGTPVKSPVDGVVTNIENNPKGLGLTVTVRDAKGHEHKLGHLGSVAVKVGQRVRSGQPVAQVGSSGASTGPHLDVREQAPNGQPVDPTAKLGPLAQMPRADDGSEPQPPTGQGQDFGVGGVYVKEPDGSMHWDETKADPNPNGGSVLDSGGNVIPGANRQSGPTGPGGTGPAGSQARRAHIQELVDNPSFRSTGGGSMFDTPGAASDPFGTLMSWGAASGKSQSAPDLRSAMPSLRSTAGVDAQPLTGSKLDNPWLYSGTGAGQDSGAWRRPVGAGADVSNPTSPNFQITPPSGSTGNMDPYDSMYMDYLFQQLQAQSQTAAQQLQSQIAAENDRHQEAMAGAVTSQQQEQENARHNAAQEQLQVASDNLNAQTQMALAGLQSGTSIGIANAQIAAQYGLQSRQFQQNVAQSALQNPWLQKLTGMLPGYGQVGGPGGGAWTPPTGGTTFGQILQNASDATPTAFATMPNMGAVPQINLPQNWQGTQSGAANNSNPYLNPSGPTSSNLPFPEGTFVKDPNSQLIGQIKNGQFVPFHSWQEYLAAGGPTDPRNPSLADFSKVQIASPQQWQQLQQSMQSLNTSSQAAQPPGPGGGPAGTGPTGTPGSPPSGGETTLGNPWTGTPGSWGGGGSSSGAGSLAGGTGLSTSPAGYMPTGNGNGNGMPTGGGWRGPTVVTGKVNTGGPGASTPYQNTDVSFNDFQNWSPFQMAAWRTAEEAQGPGAFQQEQDYLLNNWGQQGITGPSDTSQLSWDQSGPMGQMQKGMQSEFFGQAPGQYQQNQQRNWARASNSGAASALT